MRAGIAGDDDTLDPFPFAVGTFGGTGGGTFGPDGVEVVLFVVGEVDFFVASFFANLFSRYAFRTAADRLSGSRMNFASIMSVPLAFVNVPSGFFFPLHHSAPSGVSMKSSTVFASGYFFRASA